MKIFRYSEELIGNIQVYIYFFEVLKNELILKNITWQTNFSVFFLFLIWAQDHTQFLEVSIPKQEQLFDYL